VNTVEVRVLCPTCRGLVARIFRGDDGAPHYSTSNVRAGRNEEGTVSLSIAVDGPLYPGDTIELRCGRRAACPPFTIRGDEAIAKLNVARVGVPYRWRADINQSTERRA
jgi:hypothetical protein